MGVYSLLSRLCLGVLGFQALGDIGAHWDNIKVIWGLYGGYIGIVEKKMETTVTGFMGFRV